DDERAKTGLRGGYGLDFVGEDERAGVEIFFVVARNAQSGFESSDVSVGFVFDDYVELVQAGTKRNRLLVDRRAGDGLLEERFGKIAGDGIFKGLHDVAGHIGDASVDIERGGLHAADAVKFEVAVGDL